VIVSAKGRVLEMTVGIIEDDDVVLEGVVSPASL
jgi:hypothetical protein